jgi:hypothetical protein
MEASPSPPEGGGGGGEGGEGVGEGGESSPGQNIPASVYQQELHFIKCVSF